MKNEQEEYHAQCAIFDWANLEVNRLPDLEFMFSTLNGVRLTIGQATKAKRSGNKKGVPDIWLPAKRDKYSGLIIELKKVKGGVVSKEQKRWIEYLRTQGYCALVCRGSEVAIAEIKYYLAGVVE